MSSGASKEKIKWNLQQEPWPLIGTACVVCWLCILMSCAFQVACLNLYLDILGYLTYHNTANTWIVDFTSAYHLIESSMSLQLADHIANYLLWPFSHYHGGHLIGCDDALTLTACIFRCTCTDSRMAWCRFYSHKFFEGFVAKLSVCILWSVSSKSIGMRCQHHLFWYVPMGFRYTYKMGHRLSNGTFIWSKSYSFKSSPYPGQDSLQRIIIFGDMGKVLIRSFRFSHHCFSGLSESWGYGFLFVVIDWQWICIGLC